MQPLGCVQGIVVEIRYTDLAVEEEPSYTDNDHVFLPCI
jgi:hypothetical protein